MKSNSIEVRPIAGAIGAEIHGIDLADSPSDEQFDTVRRAFLDHQVIFFRDQALDPDSHKELGRRFGELNIHGYYKSLPGHPEILPVLKEPEATENIGGVWHSDVTYLAGAGTVARSSMRWKCRRRAATRCSQASTTPMRRCRTA